ncbi:MAG: hypothetical protein DMG05_03320 [Acidobacteria bacterium]|nr:MAG: hypothetical protein DMG05_03320 [Acidobacteriota bacterium]
MALQGALDATKVLESGIMDRNGEPFRFSTADSHHWSFHVHRDPKACMVTKALPQIFKPEG